jgi:hypothetical protein
MFFTDQDRVIKKYVCAPDIIIQPSEMHPSDTESMQKSAHGRRQSRYIPLERVAPGSPQAVLVPQSGNYAVDFVPSRMQHDLDDFT